MENMKLRGRLRVAVASKLSSVQKVVAAFIVAILMVGAGLLIPSSANADSSIYIINPRAEYTCSADGSIQAVFTAKFSHNPNNPNNFQVGTLYKGAVVAETTYVSADQVYSSGRLAVKAGDQVSLWAASPVPDAIQHTFTVPADQCYIEPEPTPTPTPTPEPTVTPEPEPTVIPTPVPTPTNPVPTPTPTTSPTVPPTEPPVVKPTLDSVTLTTACFTGNKPGAQAAVNVNVPKGSGPVKVTVKEEESDKVLFEETISKSGQVDGGDLLPEGYYKLIVLLNGNVAGNGYVTVKACEDTSTPTPTLEPTPEPTVTPEPEPTVIPTPVPTPTNPVPTPTPTSPAPSPAPVPVPNNPTPPSPMTPPTKVTPPAQQSNTTNVPPLASTGDTVITAGSNSTTPAAPVTPFALVGLLLVFIAMGIKVSSPKRRNRSSSIDGA